MKQKDLALIGIVAIISIVVATLASNVLIGSGGRQQEAEVVDSISSTFNNPDRRYFNDKSVDPTQIIRIGENANPTPFEQTQ